MQKHVDKMIDSYLQKFDPLETRSTPAGADLFKKGRQDNIPPQRKENFHSVVAQGLYICKRTRPDIQPTIAVLCTRTQDPRLGDWRKLGHLIKYMKATREDKLILKADSINCIKWYVDASFAVHPEFESHTGAVMTLGQGAAISVSRKQKLNTRSSTEAELVGADDAAVLILWTKLFIEAQGYYVDRNILFQDNRSAMLLEINGKKSSSNRTRHLNVRYFFLTDQVQKRNLSIQYCPTDKMTADFMTKPLQGEKFQEFKRQIMGWNKYFGLRQALTPQ